MLNARIGQRCNVACAAIVTMAGNYAILMYIMLMIIFYSPKSVDIKQK